MFAFTDDVNIKSNDYDLKLYTILTNFMTDNIRWYCQMEFILHQILTYMKVEHCVPMQS